MRRPGCPLLLAFFADHDPMCLGEPFDHKVTLAYRWSPGRLADLLGEAGFSVDARTVREPQPGERFQQGCLLARKPAEVIG